MNNFSRAVPYGGLLAVNNQARRALNAKNYEYDNKINGIGSG